ncbi:hypothetical protein AALO_G00283280 [Alosa alosa]|uniref:FISNA domain-containing protein n=1 Tax=Alosa alosa TaxID=278164 RepID=A0AAV6FNA4_9TELE|nr:hypothetical protein AALO_G00283280 [Alosa alosa]
MENKITSKVKWKEHDAGEEEEEDQAGPSSQLTQKEKKLQASMSHVMDSDPDGKKRSRDSKVGVSSSDSDRWTPEEAEVHEKFRSTLKSKFQHLVEGIPNLGESRLLHEIYTDLYITEGGGGVNNEHEPVSVDVLLTNLIKKNLLPSALLWITTRPAAVSQIPPECVDQVTEIRGFNDPQKEEYFRKRISDENLANRTITHLMSSRTLYIMCHIPVFCWISATVLEKDNLIFYEEDLRECGIDVTEASVYSGVCTQIFREESGLYQGRVFSFVHLSIQEFLAALYVLICFRSIERSMSDQHQTSQLSALFRAATLHDLHKTAVDLALQSENGHLDLFLRFLLGLSLESNQNLLMHLLPQTIRQPQSSEQTVQYVKQKIRDQHNSDRKINLFYCLNELNRHAVVEVIDRSSGALFVDTLIPGEWTTSRFEFKMSEEQLNELDLQKYIKTTETDQTELLSPDEVLQRLGPVVTASTSAKLQYCSLTEKSCAAIASAATSNSCSLKELNLSENELHDAGVQHLSELLKNPHCKLETPRVSLNMQQQICGGGGNPVMSQV